MFFIKDGDFVVGFVQIRMLFINSGLRLDLLLYLILNCRSKFNIMVNIFVYFNS